MERLCPPPHFRRRAVAEVIVRSLLPVAAMALVLSAQADPVAPQALNSLSSTPALVAAPVFDTNGARIGSVANVTPGPTGNLWSVTVRLTNGPQGQAGATQTVLASHASFDGQKVVVDLMGQPRG